MFSMTSASNVMGCVKTARPVTNQPEIVIMDAMIIGLEISAMVCCFICNETVFYFAFFLSQFYQRFFFTCHAFTSVFIIYSIYTIFKTKNFKTVHYKMLKGFVYTDFEKKKMQS